MRISGGHKSGWPLRLADEAGRRSDPGPSQSPRLRSGRFSHCVQRRSGEKPRPCLTLLTRVGINCAKDSLRQSDVDSGGLISELTEVNVYDRPGPAAIAALAAQMLDDGRLRKGLAVVQ